MPMYEYKCTKCSHRFEVIQKFSDPPKTKCPVCKGPVEKLLSAPAIQFKGSGWYVTDYGGKGSSGSSRSSDSEKESAKPAKKEDKSKSEKPAEKESEKKEPS